MEKGIQFKISCNNNNKQLLLCFHQCFLPLILKHLRKHESYIFPLLFWHLWSVSRLYLSFEKRQNLSEKWKMITFSHFVSLSLISNLLYLYWYSYISLSLLLLISSHSLEYCSNTLTWKSNKKALVLLLNINDKWLNMIFWKQFIIRIDEILFSLLTSMN